jgi:hypothetical protein
MGKVKPAASGTWERRHNMGSLAKIVHSLRFQLPTVVLGVFLGMLFLLMLFFHEMGKILVKTRQLAESAEISDLVATWNNGITSGARERTKLMSLGKESYLRSFQVSLNESNDVYGHVMRLDFDTNARSSRELKILHRKHLEYMELLDNFSKEQGARRLALAAEAAKPKPPPAPVVRETKVAKAAKSGKGRISKSSKSRKGARQARSTSGRSAWTPKRPTT